MKANIDTKFNVGDVVYKPLAYNGEWFAERTPYKICKIHIKITDKFMISYELNDVFDLCTYTENMLFASYEECKQFVNDCNHRLTNTGKVI